jgi:protein-S-isoprenylcysteine O-methyltransferase Ste14
MQRDTFKAYILVAVQVISLTLIVITGRPFAQNILLLISEIAGIVLGVWALLVMGWHNLNITPLVKQDARLVTRGPYAFIRHPMYSALLFTVWPLIIDQFSLFRLTAALILTVDLLTKLFYEENLLKQHFAGYNSYMKKTKRLIPFVF